VAWWGKFLKTETHKAQRSISFYRYIQRTFVFPLLGKSQHAPEKKISNVNVFRKLGKIESVITTRSVFPCSRKDVSKLMQSLGDDVKRSIALYIANCRNELFHMASEALWAPPGDSACDPVHFMPDSFRKKYNECLKRGQWHLTPALGLQLTRL